MSKHNKKELSVEEEIERVRNDEDLKEIKFSQEAEDAMYEKIAQIRARKIQEIEAKEGLGPTIGFESEMDKPVMSDDERYKHLTAREREAILLDKELEIHEQQFVKKRGRRVMLVLAAALVLSMAMGTVGITSRYKELQMMEKQAEDMQYRFIDSEIDMEESDDVIEEREAKAKVEEFFGQPVLWVHGLEFEEAIISQELDRVVALFSRGERTVICEMERNGNKTSSYLFGDEIIGEQYEIHSSISVFNITTYIEDSEDTIACIVETAHNGIVYSIIFSVEDESEIEKIIKNIE